MNNISFDAVKQTVKAIQENPEQGIKKWFARVTWKDGVQNEIAIREFPVTLTDEPTPLGGTDKAPNPVEQLIGAAAGCFAITFEVIASQSGIKLEKVEVEIEADLDAAVFLGLKEGNGGILDPKLRLKATTDAPKEKVKEIANIAISKSPVLLSLKADLELTVE